MSKKILVVDNNEDNLAIFRNLLDQIGCEVFATRNDLEADLVAMECKPGLIFMSMRSPSIGRMISLCGLRRNPNTRHIPLVAVTAKTLVEEIRETVGFGFNDFLHLPFDESKLKAIIDRYFQPGITITGCEYSTH